MAYNPSKALKNDLLYLFKFMAEMGHHQPTANEMADSSGV
jgi:hypothetical protein